MHIVNTIEAELAWARKMVYFAGWMGTSVEPLNLDHALQQGRFENRVTGLEKFLPVAKAASEMAGANSNTERLLQKTLDDLLV